MRLTSGLAAHEANEKKLRNTSWGDKMVNHCLTDKTGRSVSHKYFFIVIKLRHCSQDTKSSIGNSIQGNLTFKNAYWGAPIL